MIPCKVMITTDNSSDNGKRKPFPHPEDAVIVAFVPETITINQNTETGIESYHRDIITTVAIIQFIGNNKLLRVPIDSIVMPDIEKKE